MRALGIAVLVGGLCFLGTVGLLALMVVSALNTEATQKNGIIAQEDVREAAFDRMWKKIAQVTQITKASSELQAKLVASLASGRSGAFIKLVQESNPESAFDRGQFEKLANMVEGERDSFFREQKVLVSKVQEYNNRFDTFPSGTILSVFGRQRYPAPKIISSDKTKDVRESGTDNDVGLDL